MGISFRKELLPPEYQQNNKTSHRMRLNINGVSDLIFSDIYSPRPSYFPTPIWSPPCLGAYMMKYGTPHNSGKHVIEDW